MTEFEERMKQIADGLSREARVVVRIVLEREHRLRFGDRSELPETYALEALRLTERKGGGS